MSINERRAGADRRQGSIFNGSLPFLTKSGLVFHERRSQPDRRASQMGQQDSQGSRQAGIELT